MTTLYKNNKCSCIINLYAKSKIISMIYRAALSYVYILRYICMMHASTYSVYCIRMCENRSIVKHIEIILLLYQKSSMTQQTNKQTNI